MLLDNVLRKATKAAKKPHWCVEHQKWEAEDHDKGIEKAASGGGGPKGKGFSPGDNPDTGLGRMNVHAEVVPITLDWNPFKRQQKPDSKSQQPSPEYRQIYPETQGDKLNRVVDAARAEKKNDRGIVSRLFGKDVSEDIGAAPPPELIQRRIKKSVNKSFTVMDNLLFLMKADTSSDRMSIENPDNMGLDKGPAEMKHVMDVPGYGTVRYSAAIKAATGRAMIVATLPDGTRQGFYQRTGHGGNEGASNRGDWVPIDGIDTGGHWFEGWMDKSRLFDDSKPSDDDIQRYGNEDFMKIGRAFDNHRDTLGTPTPEEFAEAGHEDANHEGHYSNSPWSILEINNWLGTDVSKEHNKWAEENMDTPIQTKARGGRDSTVRDAVYGAHEKTVKARVEQGIGTPPEPQEDVPTEPEVKPEPEPEVEEKSGDDAFNEYAKGIYNGERYSLDDHARHFRHAMSGYGTFKPGAVAQQPLHRPESEDGKFTFDDAYPYVRDSHRQSYGTSYEPSDHTMRKHGTDDRKWFKDRNDWMFDKYPQVMNHLEKRGEVYKLGQGTGQSLSPLTGDVVKHEETIDKYMKDPLETGHRVRAPLPRPNFVHPQHAEERVALDAQQQQQQQQQQGIKMREMIPPEAPIRGGQYPGIQNALLKIIKSNSFEKVMDRPEPDDEDMSVPEERKNPARIKQEWGPRQAAARMNELGETGGTDRLGPIGRDAPPGFEDETAKQKKQELASYGKRMREVPMPTGTQLNAIENALLKIMKEEISSKVQNLGRDAKPWKPSKRDEQMVDLGEISTHTPGVKTTRPLEGKTILPPGPNETKEDWMKRTFPDKSIDKDISRFTPEENTQLKRDDAKVGKKTYPQDPDAMGAETYINKPVDRQKKAGTESVQAPIQDALLKIMKYGSDMKPADVGMTRKSAMRDVEKAPAAPREEGAADRMAAEMSGAGDEGAQQAKATAGGIAEGVAGLFGQAASGQGKVQQYYADQAKQHMDAAKKGGTSDTDTAGDPQQTGLMGGTGGTTESAQTQTANQPAAGGAASPDVPKMNIPSAFGNGTAPPPGGDTPPGGTPPGGTEQPAIPGTTPGEIPKPKGTKIPLAASMKKAFGIRSK